MESVDDITAAATQPVPIMEMTVGVRYCSVMGMTRAVSPRSSGDGEPYAVRFQSEARTQQKERLKNGHMICWIDQNLQNYAFISDN